MITRPYKEKDQAKNSLAIARDSREMLATRWLIKDKDKPRYKTIVYFNW